MKEYSITIKMSVQLTDSEIETLQANGQNTLEDIVTDAVLLKIRDKLVNAVDDIRFDLLDEYPDEDYGDSADGKAVLDYIIRQREIHK